MYVHTYIRTFVCGLRYVHIHMGTYVCMYVCVCCVNTFMHTCVRGGAYTEVALGTHWEVELITYLWTLTKPLVCPPLLGLHRSESSLSTHNNDSAATDCTPSTPRITLIYLLQHLEQPNTAAPPPSTHCEMAISCSISSSDFCWSPLYWRWPSTGTTCTRPGTRDTAPTTRDHDTCPPTCWPHNTPPTTHPCTYVHVLELMSAVLCVWCTLE